MDGQILAGLASKAKNPADFKILGEACRSSRSPA